MHIIHKIIATYIQTQLPWLEGLSQQLVASARGTHTGSPNFWRLFMRLLSSRFKIYSCCGFLAGLSSNWIELLWRCLVRCWRRGQYIFSFAVAWCFYKQLSKDLLILPSQSLFTKQSQLRLEDYARISVGIFHSCMLLHHTMMSVSVLLSPSGLGAYG